MLKNIFFSIKHKTPLKRSNGAASHRIPPQLLTKSLKKELDKISSPFLIVFLKNYPNNERTPCVD